MYITDRASDMIVSGGVNIYPAEAEEVLLDHPKVADVAVIGVPNRDMGEEVKALVVPVDATDAPAPEELIAWCRSGSPATSAPLGRHPRHRRAHGDGEGQQARAAPAVLGAVMVERLVSLAAGTVLDVDPAGTVDVAAAAGFDAAGLWFDPATWSTATTAEVARRLQATGIVGLDIEPVILGRDHDPGDALVDTAAELGVRHVLVASGPAERTAVVERFGELCERAAAGGVVVVLEFLPIFTIASLADAVGVVEEVAHPSGAVLVDTLHLARSGSTADDVRRLPARLFPYLQLADAPAAPAGRGRDELRDEALHGRLLPGDGDLPLLDVLDAVPGVPLSVELRSAALMERWPDAVERARAVRAATGRLLDAQSPLV